MRMMLNRRDNGEDGKTENTPGRPDSSYSLQELLIFPQPMDSLAIALKMATRIFLQCNKMLRMMLGNSCSN